jgi:hypothetical protein
MRFHCFPDYIFLTFNLLRCVQIGQFYHAANTSAAISKIDWHPWGEAGSTLLVMTVDGKLRYVCIIYVLQLHFLMINQRIRYLSRHGRASTNSHFCTREKAEGIHGRRRLGTRGCFIYPWQRQSRLGSTYSICSNKVG